jgi:pantothenate kinase type III
MKSSASYMQMGTWIGIVACIIGSGTAIGAVLATAGSIGIYITIGIFIMLAAMFGLFYKLLIAPALNKKRLQKIGIVRKGTIMDVIDTGVTINKNPQVKLILQLKNKIGQQYTAGCNVLVSRINQNCFFPGMEVPVKIDPENEKNIILDLD